MKKIRKHLFPIFFALLLIPSKSVGQKNIAGAGLHEFGLGVGALNYTGELSPGFNFGFFRPGGMLFYRYNISPVVSFRLAFLGGSIFANEAKLLDPIHQARKIKFSSQITEFAGTVEYNFFNYRPKKEVYRYSPYLTTGFTLFNAKHTGGFQVGIPMGLGLKYRLSKRINIGLELVARKTFTDKLDNTESLFIGVHQTANPNDKDWYYYAGFSISWTSFSVICPDQYYQ
jgi:hypothetical protein